MKREIETIEHEQVDDIPLLMAVIKQMGLIEIFNEQIKAHGNWEGLGAGEIIGVWLAYILSEGDHRKCYLEDWVAERKRTLQSCLGVEKIERLDFTDDRLGLILGKLNEDEVWQKSEQAVNERLLRVYELAGEIRRVDMTTASSYGRVTEAGLLQFGHSKDHRPDLGQVKIASVSLDPLGLPLVTVPVSGEQADDKLYLPVIEQARHSLGSRKGLYVGDVKMGALEIRCHLACQGDGYLMPLSRVQVSEERLLDYLAQFEARPEAERQMERVTTVDEAGEEQLIAEGFTIEVELAHSHPDKGQPASYEWTERRFVVLSAAYADKQQRQLEQRLTKAEAALKKLVEPRQGYPYPQTKQALQERIVQVLTELGCQPYLTVEISQETVTKHIRAYKERPARVETHQLFHLKCERNQDALAQAYRLMGWRVYATNAAPERLSLAQAEEVYRDAYLHEHGYSRLKGKPLSLTPLFLQKDDQITGLIRLLSLALRVLTLIEFVVRQHLALQQAELKGIYAGNRQRKTKTPRTETLLRVFKGIILTIIPGGDTEWLHLSPLSPTQKRILQLMGLPDEVYTSLVPEFMHPAFISAN